jgi:glucose-6-phosphate 1-dehydrogenase
MQSCAAHLTASGLAAPARKDSCVRVVIEKPIGNDLESARQINVQLAEHFAESQIFRIDHYLGKETVENLMVLRFANVVFEPLWNSRFVDHVQITVAEEEGVGSRSPYYEGAGALRDMVQSHLLQVLCMVTMEPPRSLEADAVRDAKLDVLRELRPFEREEIASWVVRGQYAEGLIGRETALAYRAEKGVAPDSKIETYVALRCFVENWRWARVPFYLRTGKRLPKRVSEIAICFKALPRILFNRGATPLEANLLAICIQPGEGLSLNIISKVPGPPLRLNPVKVDFHYRTAAPEAYETLLRDVMSGDQTLFMRRDHVEQAWSFIQPILDEWALSGAQPFGYPAGLWGPVEAAMMIAADGRAWRKL